MTIIETAARQIDPRTLPANYLLDDRQAAAALDVKASTLCVWRSTGRYSLPFVKVGRKVRYKAGDLAAFLESRTHANGATT